MKKKIVMLIILCVFGITSSAMASDWFSIGHGYDGDITINRLGLKKDFDYKWFESDVGYLSGYFELSYNNWKYDQTQLHGIALSPVFTYNFKTDMDMTPYIEIGSGPSYFDKHRIANKYLGCQFQFENRLGVGIKKGVFDFNIRYMHYSNGYLNNNNSGMDMVIFSIAISF